MADSLWYPSVEDVVAIHDDIVAEYPDTPAGVRNRGDIEFVLNYIEAGSFGSSPDTSTRRVITSSGSSSPIIPSSMRTNELRST
nr:hypothetical protein [Halorubrum sp. JWXQ-INN 858]